LLQFSNISSDVISYYILTLTCFVAKKAHSGAIMATHVANLQLLTYASYLS